MAITYRNIYLLKLNLEHFSDKGLRYLSYLAFLTVSVRDPLDANTLFKMCRKENWYHNNHKLISAFSFIYLLLLPYILL